MLRRADGETVPLTPRVVDTLLFLVENPDTVLDKERIMEAVWPDTIVEEKNLAQNISTLRRVFGETSGAHRHIVTVPGRGYRFVAKVKHAHATASPNGRRPTPPNPVGEAASFPLPRKITPSPIAQRPPRSFHRAAFVAALVLLLATTLVLVQNRRRVHKTDTAPLTKSRKAIAALSLRLFTSSPAARLQVTQPN